ncbi:DUF5993 family protein [Stappia stellulata]|uniref:DUF5993 family protein n=1 Tax=Stappia stellulata TaxID=71235 RepID=UPI00055B7252|nr:DUF5993 family protein [Stappia stellulata]
MKTATDAEGPQERTPSARPASSCPKVCDPMYLTALFLLLTATLVVAARGSRPAALGLATVSFIVAVGVYFHHASDALPLSF